MRQRLAATLTTGGHLDEIAEAIARLRPGAAPVYVERRKSLYRWSIAHGGGPYPLLRELAQFLELPHSELLLRCAAVDDHSIVAPADGLGPPDLYAFIAPTGDAIAIARAIEAKLARVAETGPQS